MKRSGMAGITQLELMVSLAIMGLITVLLANALNFNRQTIVRYGALSETADEMLNRRALKNWIEQIPLASDGADAIATLEGDESSFRFNTLTIDGTFWGGALTEVAVTLRSVDGAQALVLQGVGRHPTEEEPLEREWMLVQPVGRIALSYFGRVSHNSDKGWQSNWSDTNFLPDLVKIEWEGPHGEPVPPLTLQPAKRSFQRYMSLSSLVPPE